MDGVIDNKLIVQADFGFLTVASYIKKKFFRALLCDGLVDLVSVK